MNKKGFTLVELLVVMVILGIITAISIPLIRNIRQSNVQKEYKNYMNSVLYGAKLYIDSYGEDLFGHNETGCAIISYKDLKDKNLVKDFDKDNMSCASEDTYVRVVKMGTKYGYAVSIGCGKKDENGNIVVSYKYPKEGVASSETCGVDATAIMSFDDDVDNPNSYKFKKRSMKVIITSNTGIYSNPQIQYGFSDTMDGATISNWGALDVKPEAVDKQRERILAGETIRVTSKQIETPGGLTGKYYLVLRIDRLQDANQNNWAVEGSSNYVYLGPYTLDNTKPAFNDSTVISSNASYNALKPKLNLKVTDNLSASNETQAKSRLKMCTSFGTDSCIKTKAAFGDTTKYIAYEPDKVLDNIKSALDGSKNKVYVTVVDPAGNYETKEFEYELASVITYNGNNHTGGSTSKTYCNNNTDCPLRANGFERTGYSYTGWYNAASGGTKYGATVRLNGNLTVYAQWQVITYNITYNLNGGTATNNATYTVETPTFTLNNPTKTGYTFTGWTGSNGTTKQKTVKITKGSIGDKNYTANYSINSYTLTYDLNGHGSCSQTSITKNYNEKWGTLCSPTATGYTFSGWKNGSTTVTENSTATANITVTAVWTPITYNITYNYNGGSATNNTTYTIETNTFTLNNPTKSGNTFRGWTGSNGTTPQTSVSISKGSTGDKSYTANWTPSTPTVTSNTAQIDTGYCGPGSGCTSDTSFIITKITSFKCSRSGNKLSCTVKTRTERRFTWGVDTFAFWLVFRFDELNNNKISNVKSNLSCTQNKPGSPDGKMACIKTYDTGNPMPSPRDATVTFDVDLSGYTGTKITFYGKVWNNGCVTSKIKYTTNISKCQQLKYTITNI